MDVCQAYKEARRKWLMRYQKLEKCYNEAERTKQWFRVELIGEALLEMEANAGFRKCLSCSKKGCPAHFDGFVSWEPMDADCRMIKI